MDRRAAKELLHIQGWLEREIEDGEIVEKGHYIAEGGNNFWGVEVVTKDGQEYVAASDRDNGLWIFKYTPTP